MRPSSDERRALVIEYLDAAIECAFRGCNRAPDDVGLSQPQVQLRQSQPIAALLNDFDRPRAAASRPRGIRASQQIALG